MSLTVNPPTYADVLQASKDKGPVMRTRTFRSVAFSDACGGDIWLKSEHQQKTGSFKLRGAWNHIRHLKPGQPVVAASAGNHAQGVALAAKTAGLRSTIVMPRSASPAKVAATRRLGADIVLFGESYAEAAAHARTMQGVMVHAFDDPLVIAGQGVIGLEILEQVPDVECVCVPAGGGGLLAGVALAVKHDRPDVRVCGVRTGVNTISDGTAVDKFGEITGAVIREHVDEVVNVDDDHITRAIFTMMERHRTIVEPAGAVALAHLLESGNSGRTVCVVSGGNIDMWLLSQIVNSGLAAAGRLVSVSMVLPDRPGVFSGVMDVIAQANANLVDMGHDRLTVGVGMVRVTVSLETDGPEGTDKLIDALHQSGLKFQIRGIAGSDAVSL